MIKIYTYIFFSSDQFFWPKTCAMFWNIWENNYNIFLHFFLQNFRVLQEILQIWFRNINQYLTRTSRLDFQSKCVPGLGAEPPSDGGERGEEGEAALEEGYLGGRSHMGGAPLTQFFNENNSKPIHRSQKRLRIVLKTF